MFAAALTAPVKTATVQAQRLRSALIQWRFIQMKKRLQVAPAVLARASTAWNRRRLTAHLIHLGTAVALAAASLTATAQQVPMLPTITRMANAFALTDPAAPATAAKPVAPAVSLDPPGLPKAAPSRGELLYTTHCISCHTTEMHWRDKRVANDWTSLKKQVRRWQDASSLAWRESDITEVARYLNETIYLFDKPAEPVSSLGSQGAAPTSVASRLPPQRSQRSP